MDIYNTVNRTWFDWYVEPDDVDDWKQCPQCKHKPKVWIFDNGRYAACACCIDYNVYDRRIVSAESIMSVVRRTGGDISTYDKNDLKKTWNEDVESRLKEVGGNA